MSPLALGLGIVIFIASFDEDHGSGGGGGGTVLASGSLKVGKGAVPAEYAGLIQSAASSCDQGLPAAVLAAQLEAESGFNPRAQSPGVGAQGIAQFMPDTWASEGIDANHDGRKDVWDPADAIPSQGSMMCKLLKDAKRHPEYNGSPIELALAGYNAGWGRVEQYRGVPPSSFANGETYSYVQAIMADVKRLTAPDTGGTPDVSGGWSLPVKAPLGTPYHQAGGMWSSGYHTGIDFAVSPGTPIHAVGPGKVITAGAGGAYGNQVVIQHPDGVYSQYAHMTEVKVSAGQTVTGGQLIGLSGATGNVSGPHLHMEVRTGPEYGSDIDPVAYLLKKGLRI
ncbi:peptidoglycan DD-metalloendopeptidase family protein [Streptomyces syringium]|uniref:peptidoglycan DD-metalloendopeptidase family protein n=1 Tax=Streptomyces syringium TaxID=76729 RepID=UPI0037CD4D3F